jgi:hypothetical protein
MDEAQFTCDGINSSWNSHFCRHENPRKVPEHYFQCCFSVSAWCEVLGSCLIEPHIFKGHHTAAYYKNFLQNDLPLYLEQVPLSRRGQMWIQHDEASPHFATEVTDFLSDSYHGRWLGQGDQMSHFLMGLSHF